MYIMKLQPSKGDTVLGKEKGFMEKQSQEKLQPTLGNFNMMIVAFHICRGKIDYNKIFIAALFIKTSKQTKTTSTFTNEEPF